MLITPDLLFESPISLPHRKESVRPGVSVMFVAGSGSRSRSAQRTAKSSSKTLFFLGYFSVYCRICLNLDVPEVDGMQELLRDDFQLRDAKEAAEAGETLPGTQATSRLRTV